MKTKEQSMWYKGLLTAERDYQKGWRYHTSSSVSIDLKHPKLVGTLGYSAECKQFIEGMLDYIKHFDTNLQGFTS